MDKLTGWISKIDPVLLTLLLKIGVNIQRKGLGYIGLKAGLVESIPFYPLYYEKMKIGVNILRKR